MPMNPYESPKATKPDPTQTSNSAKPIDAGFALAAKVFFFCLLLGMLSPMLPFLFGVSFTFATVVLIISISLTSFVAIGGIVLCVLSRIRERRFRPQILLCLLWLPFSFVILCKLFYSLLH